MNCSLVKMLQTQSCLADPLYYTTDSPSGQCVLTCKYEYDTFEIGAPHDFVPYAILLVWFWFLWNKLEIFLDWAWIRRTWEQEVYGDAGFKNGNLWGMLTHWGDLLTLFLCRAKYLCNFICICCFLDQSCSVMYSHWKVYELLANIQGGLMHLFVLSCPKFLFDLFSVILLINPRHLWKLYCQFQWDYRPLYSPSYCLVEWHWWAAY